MNERKEIRFIELFCGVGGFRLGLEGAKDSPHVLLHEPGMADRGRDIQDSTDAGLGERARFACVWANDIDKYACHAYRKRFGNRGGLLQGEKAEEVQGDVPGTEERQDGAHGRPGSESGEWDEASKLYEERIRMKSNIMGFLTEKHEPCPWCGIQLDLDTVKYPMEKKVFEKCPWCGRMIRILKRLRRKPKVSQGIYFVVTKCLKEGSGRRRK